MDWVKYFDNLTDWKKLPSYRAELRINSFIGYYLQDILTDYLKIEIEEIIPEVNLIFKKIY